MMSFRDERSRVIAIVEICAAAVLIVAMFLAWFAAHGGSGAGTASWIDLLTRSSWLKALEADLITFGALVAIAGGVTGFLGIRREVSLGIGLGGFVAGLVGVIWLLVESGNAAFVWNGWGADVDPGLGLWLFAVAAVVGGVAATIGLVGLDPEPAVGEPPVLTPSYAGTPVLASPDPQPTLSGGAVHAPVAPGRLTVVEGDHSSSIDIAEGERVIVGRDLGSDIRVADAKVSRRHAMIEWTAGAWVVRDLGTTNPTRVLEASGSTHVVAGQIRIPSGQLLMGEVLITLFPAGG